MMIWLQAMQVPDDAETRSIRDSEVKFRLNYYFGQNLHFQESEVECRILEDL